MLNNVMESDIANREFAGATNPDGLLSVTFYSRAIQNNFESQKQGRPVFEDCDFVRILTPGNQLNIIDTFAREEHKQRFPIQWQRYKNNAGEQLIGTPVDQWPVVTRAQAEELKGLKFYTVEQIAGCSDVQKQALGMIGPMLVAQAKAWLAKAADSAAVTAQAAELKKRDDTIDAMKKQIDQMQAVINALPQAPKVASVKASAP